MKAIDSLFVSVLAFACGASLGVEVRIGLAAPGAKAGYVGRSSLWFRLARDEQIAGSLNSVRRTSDETSIRFMRQQVHSVISGWLAATKQLSHYSAYHARRTMIR